MKNPFKVRVVVKFNIGTRVEKPKKGRGSYNRKKIKILAN